VKGTLHWVSVPHAVEAEIRLYDRLFTEASPDADKERDFLDFINPDSLKVIKGYLEPGLKDASIGEKFQFQRIGYFCIDKDSTPENLIFNRTVTLRDSWDKIAEYYNFICF
jgi:glutaminyl-tRNA synthetase